MSPISIVPALIALMVVYVTTAMLFKLDKTQPEQGRFVSIDGLRGYLAFFVFLHHSCIWFFYLKTGKWQVPPSNIYTHFGQASVALFFMITGFLFFNKLLNSREKSMDFLRLLVSRMMRLIPLYIFTILIMLFIVYVLSGTKLQENPVILIQQVFAWVLFTFFGNPDINGVSNTYIITAGVIWSLPYEWYFYLSLPVFAWIIGVKTPQKYLLAGILTLVLLRFWWHPQSIYFSAFLGGVVASFLVRNPLFCGFSQKKSTSILVFSLIVVAVTQYSTAYATFPLILLTIVFSLIAGGNTFFNLLSTPISRLIGEMAYSLYLLHGIVLFILFTFVVGYEKASLFSPLQHWFLIVLVTPFLVVTCFLTFRYIEKPAILYTNEMTEKIRALFTRL